MQRHAVLAVTVPAEATTTRSEQWEGAAITLINAQGAELARLAYGGYATFYF